MRHVELVLRPGAGGFHPAEGKIIESPDVQRIAIHHFNQLDDGTVVFLYQVRGDIERAREVLDGETDVLAHSISRSGNDLHAYIHFQPNDIVDGLLSLPQEHSVIVDTPIECLPDGGIRVNGMAQESTVTEALGTLPEGLEVELEAIGEYDPDDRQLFSMLTERQQDILLTAMDMGYYDVPRQATYEDIGDELGIAPVTVGEHLRKIESRVLTEITPGN
ncbi:MAG: helix-turn-helix domain-containing protein [Halorientalis sp.]